MPNSVFQIRAVQQSLKPFVLAENKSLSPNVATTTQMVKEQSKTQAL